MMQEARKVTMARSSLKMRLLPEQVTAAQRHANIDQYASRPFQQSGDGEGVVSRRMVVVKRRRGEMRPWLITRVRDVLQSGIRYAAASREWDIF
jgi:hypothetical protein